MGSRHAWLWTLAAAWCAYASSSIHRLAGGDSGELLAEACVGGTAHPPGYPLLLLLLRAVRHVGNYACPHVPFVVLANYFNAACASGAAALVTHVVELVTGRGYEIEAVAAGLMFAFSALTWEYALGLEVFALNNLFVGLLLVHFARHYGHQRWSALNLCVAALVCGLGLCNQHTIVLFEVPLIAWVLASTKLRVFDLICLSLAFMVGISPYASTYLGSKTPRPGSWGDASSFTGLLNHVLRREYGTFRLSPIRGQSDGLQSRLLFYATDAINQFSLLGIVCATLGVLAVVLQPQVFSRTTIATSKDSWPRSHSRRTCASFGLALFVTFTFYVVIFNSLANLPLNNALAREVTRRFFIQPNLVISIWLGFGLAWLHCMCLSISKSRVPVRIVQVVAITLSAQQFVRNRAAFTTSTIAQHDLVRDFATAILNGLPARAVLLSYTDIQWNSVRYLQRCELKRLDVVHLNLQMMAYPWFIRQHGIYKEITFPPTRADISTTRSSQGYAMYLSQFILANFHRHEMFLDLHGVDESTISTEQLLFGTIQVFPQGLVWKISQPAGNSESLVNAWKSFSLQPAHSQKYSNLLLKCCRIASHQQRIDIHGGSWEFVVVSIVHDAIYQTNLAKLGYWLAHTSIQTMAHLEEAVLAFESIQLQLNDIVLAGVRNSDDGITYDLYAVEKNAVVSRQRFQLYLEAFTELHNGSKNKVLTAGREKLLVSLAEQCVKRREQTVKQIQAFLLQMEAQQDGDIEAVRRGLKELEARLQQPRKLTKQKKKRSKNV